MTPVQHAILFLISDRRGSAARRCRQAQTLASSVCRRYLATESGATNTFARGYKGTGTPVAAGMEKVMPLGCNKRIESKTA
jgi:hypothetical protein